MRIFFIFHIFLFFFSTKNITCIVNKKLTKEKQFFINNGCYRKIKSVHLKLKKFRSNEEKGSVGGGLRDIANYHFKRNIYNSWNNNFPKNIIYKQIYEKTYPFKKYCIGDEYYGRILNVNSKKIKVDILCDRKACLNTSEYFSSLKLCKYINSIINIHDIIKIKIKFIQKIYKKIFVQIRKYSVSEILSSFQNDKNLINSKIFYIYHNYALVYIAPKIHAKLIIHKQNKLDKYKLGDTIPVKVDSFNSEKNELYVLDPNS
ncbi:conserved Plasmodium protein, unknown function [Plasmodium berghei]|uniref:S1 motif domain-containing protein n=2 Tax=Plasmodium berghei TaxID=5821 RepID=A0A509AF16_PLABA|nr:conserved Plasmodium protein, unknown function [Plasmodium berghei ANKA]SCL90042.1 conserved Plasmodium protein, unknown function [Plasmodium berghei]SCM15205.1 conserved Plasmodium protein, unknown function [Plasmodium berghei]SCN21842.1 conserved Plasmodium protein, unknown function [Plasmodium berghei]VUC53929.1 conserved Plasmodium protein, unknown function [Plasmodium berghei ANKA]|eukprot:XP_034419781.1 conserved Plasmodium protein, unknown function [Plasmodium berghei ANKA]